VNPRVDLNAVRNIKIPASSGNRTSFVQPVACVSKKQLKHVFRRDCLSQTVLLQGQIRVTIVRSRLVSDLQKSIFLSSNAGSFE
jgi:hypothetical protein